MSSAAERKRAFRLRAKGAALTPAEKAWLEGYQGRAAGRGRPRKVIDVVAREMPATGKPGASGAVFERLESTAPANYAGETWVPLLETAQESGQEGQGGQGKPPEPQPFVGDGGASAAAEAAAREAAAEKIGGVFALICSAGLEAAGELAAAGRLPYVGDLAKGLDPQTKAAVIAHVQGAGKRVALKHGLGAVWEYEDEATLAIAAFGSAFCVLQVRKLKELPAPEQKTGQKEQKEPPAEQMSFAGARDVFASVMRQGGL